MKHELLVFFGEHLRLAIVDPPGRVLRSFDHGDRCFRPSGSLNFPIHWDLLRSKVGLGDRMRSRKGALIGLHGEGLEEISKPAVEHLRKLPYVDLSADGKSFSVWFGNRRDGERGREAALSGLVYESTEGPPEFVLHVNWFVDEAPEFEQWTSLLIPDERLRLVGD